MRLRKASTQAGILLEHRHEDLFRLLASGAQIRRREYEELAGISKRTAMRDINLFLSLGWIEKTGRAKATLYKLAKDLKKRV
ncbi:MAG: hypothetical protein ACYTHN_03245 [Planctomycetota bacterium]|jgi:predicted HTH transcriptional regulator